MITQEMYEKGLRCKGKGFNCGGCKDKSGCFEYINTDVKFKPPLGITPKKIWEMQRMEDLKNAIHRYCEMGIEVPFECVDEYNSLVRIYNTNLNNNLSE